VSRHLRGLEDDGHLARTPDPEDRRATLLQVTESGRELVRSAREQRLTLFGKAIADWNDEDLTTLTELVRRLAQDLENV
jgi:DNA-binding MarR family transcriptional regulator